MRRRISKMINETGNRYGLLTVTPAHKSDNGIWWLCKCDCGGEKWFSGSNLRRGRTKSCGCLQDGVVDESGKRYGMLTVLRKANRTHFGSAMWECVCDCGCEYLAIGTALRAGGAKSCGCSTGNHKPPGVSARRLLFNRYRHSARSRGHEFGLSYEEFASIISADCFYCGIPPSGEVRGWSEKSGAVLYSGIDRVDSSRGYSKDNVVACCRQCNIAKLNHSVQDFIAWIKRASEHLDKKGLLNGKR